MIFRLLLAFAAGFCFFGIVFSHIIIERPHGYFIVNQTNPDEEFIKLDMRIGLTDIVNRQYVIIRVKQEK